MQVLIPCIGYGAYGLGMSPQIGLTHQQHHHYYVDYQTLGIFHTRIAVSLGNR